jgi:sec-independent protein translocase protein TatA
MGGIGFQELMVILAIVLIIFGPGKLPEIGNTLGKTVRGFRKAMEEPEMKPAVPKDPAAPDASNGVKG